MVFQQNDTPAGYQCVIRELLERKLPNRSLMNVGSPFSRARSHGITYIVFFHAFDYIKNPVYNGKHFRI